MLIIVSNNVAADLLMDALAGIIRDVLTDIDVKGVNTTVFAGVMTDFEFGMPVP